MNGMGYDQGMTYVTNIPRLRCVDKNGKLSIRQWMYVDKVVHW